MKRWKRRIIAREKMLGYKHVYERRKYNRVLASRKKPPGYEELQHKISSYACKYRPEGETYCVVGDKEKWYYVPITKKNGSCTVCIKGHPCIDMTKRCGTDVSKDKGFHGQSAQKIWNKPCTYSSDNTLNESEKVCKISTDHNKCLIC